MYQACHICLKVVEDSGHIAIDEFGDPQLCCNQCYDRAKIFFIDQRRREDNVKFRRSSKESE